MTNIEFNEEQFGGISQYSGNEEKNSKMVQLLINWGLAKDSKSANIVLIGTALVFFGLSIYFFLKVAGIVS